MTCGTLIRRWTPFCLAAIFMISGCEGYTTAEGRPAHKNTAQPTAVGGQPANHVAQAASETAQAGTASRNMGTGGASYVGLAETQLVARLGPPSAQSEDQPPGKTWRYQNRICTVNFMLYPDVETRVYRALAYEVINDDQSAAGKRLCLAELEARAHGQ